MEKKGCRRCVSKVQGTDKYMSPGMHGCGNGNMLPGQELEVHDGADDS